MTVLLELDEVDTYYLDARTGLLVLLEFAQMVDGGLIGLNDIHSVLLDEVDDELVLLLDDIELEVIEDETDEHTNLIEVMLLDIEVDDDELELVEILIDETEADEQW